MRAEREQIFAVFVTQSEAIAIGSVVLAYLRYLSSLERPTEAQRYIAEHLRRFHERLAAQAPRQRGWDGRT